MAQAPTPERLARVLGLYASAPAEQARLLSLVVARGAELDRPDAASLGQLGQLEIARVHGRAELHAGHVDLDRLRDVGGLGLDQDLDELLVEQAAGEHFTGDMHRDFHRHLLTAADQDQVYVLDVAPDRIALNRLGQRQLTPAWPAFEPDEHVGRL